MGKEERAKEGEISGREVLNKDSRERWSKKEKERRPGTKAQVPSISQNPKSCSQTEKLA